MYIGLSVSRDTASVLFRLWGATRRIERDGDDLSGQPLIGKGIIHTDITNQWTFLFYMLGNIP